GKDGVVAAALSGKGDGLVDGRGIAEPDVVGVGRTGGRVASADGRTCRVHHGGAWIPHHRRIADQIISWWCERMSRGMCVRWIRCICGCWSWITMGITKPQSTHTCIKIVTSSKHRREATYHINSAGLKQ